MPSSLLLVLVVIHMGGQTKTLLRFQHRPGEVARFRHEAKTETLQKPAGGATSVLGVRTSLLILERKTVRVSGGMATIEETPVEGTSRVETGGDKVTEIIPPITRIYTLDAQGRCHSFERRSPPGVKPGGKEFLDGLSFPLPAQPVAPGASWSAAQTVPGLQGGEVTVQMASSFERIEAKQGKKLARIRVSISAKLPEGASNQPAPVGEVSGEARYSLDITNGKEQEMSGSITVTLRPIAGQGAAPGAQTILRTTFRQVPASAK